MTANEIIERSSSLLELANRLLKVIAFLVSMFIGVTIWVYATNTNVANLRHEFDASTTQREERWAQITKFEGETNITLSRLTTVLENQQRLLERQQQQLDRK
jgi:hypothetical protein